MGLKNKKYNKVYIMDYSKSKIYKLYNNIDDEFYIGSTYMKLTKRIAKHRSASSQETFKNQKLYIKMNDIGKDKFFIEFLEEYPCENIEQLRRKEGEYIKELRPTLNKNVPGRTRKEYDIDNKEHIQERTGIYTEQHRERIKERMQSYYQQEDNKARQLEWGRKIVKCECGMDIRRSSPARHQKRQVHLNAMEQL